MASIIIRCTKCGTAFRIEALDRNSGHIVDEYGSLDRVTGRILLFPCICGGDMEKVEAGTCFCSYPLL